jgi:tetratricopeptide (TPR) repeat protein
MDTGGFSSAGKFIEKAAPTHPSCVDEAHVLGELFGVVNVPSGIWVDEEGMIVRPPEAAFPGRSAAAEMLKGVELPADADPEIVRAVMVTRRMKRPDYGKYIEALRSWVALGAASPYALAPEEVVERSRSRSMEASLAAAHFELGQHLWRLGRRDDAIPHFIEARRKQPDNWTYKRQAWSFFDPLQRPGAVGPLEGSWAGDAEEAGPENYYPDPLF